MMNVKEHKRMLRSFFKIKNNFFLENPEKLLMKQELIKRHLEMLFQTLMEKNPKQEYHILAYKPFSSEIPILEILKCSDFLDKKHCYIPAKKDNEFWATPIEKEDPELHPVSQEKIVCLENIDYIILPGLLVDSNGVRLGRGGGFYDRMVQLFSLEQLIFVGYHWQLLDPDFGDLTKDLPEYVFHDSQIEYIDKLRNVTCLPYETHDQKVGYVVTEEGILQC